MPPMSGGAGAGWRGGAAASAGAAGLTTSMMWGQAGASPHLPPSPHLVAEHTFDAKAAAREATRTLALTLALTLTLTPNPNPNPNPNQVKGDPGTCECADGWVGPKCMSQART